MKKILSILMIILTVNVVYGQLKIKVSGRVSGNTEGFNKVYLANQLAKDSATIVDGKFEIVFNAAEAGSRAISIDYDRAKRIKFFLHQMLVR